MPDGHTRRRSRGSDSESNASSAPSRQSRRRSQSVEGPPTPTSPLEARGKKRRAHFQDDPVDTDHVTVTSAHRRQPSATSPITNFCLCQREPKIPRPRNGESPKYIVYAYVRHPTKRLSRKQAANALCFHEEKQSADQDKLSYSIARPKPNLVAKIGTFRTRNSQRSLERSGANSQTTRRPSGTGVLKYVVVLHRINRSVC